MPYNKKSNLAISPLSSHPKCIFLAAELCDSMHYFSFSKRELRAKGAAHSMARANLNKAENFMISGLYKKRC